MALYTHMADMAPEQAENGPHQNHSPTDLKVNREGIQLGRALAYNKIKGKPWPLGEMNRRAFVAICDESRGGFAIQGPLSVESIGSAFSNAIFPLPTLK